VVLDFVKVYKELFQVGTYNRDDEKEDQCVFNFPNIEELLDHLDFVLKPFNSIGLHVIYMVVFGRFTIDECCYGDEYANPESKAEKDDPGVVVSNEIAPENTVENCSKTFADVAKCL